MHACESAEARDCDRTAIRLFGFDYHSPFASRKRGIFRMAPLAHSLAGRRLGSFEQRERIALEGPGRHRTILMGYKRVDQREPGPRQGYRLVDCGQSCSCRVGF